MIADLFFGLLQWVSLLFIFSFHNYLKALAVIKLGDDTPKRFGFNTFNPVVHIDIFGTVIFPLILIFVKAPIIFGWPKPVPIDYHKLKDARTGALIISAVSIVSYFLVAFLGLILYKLLLLLNFPSQLEVLIILFKYVFLISAFFGFLNLIPIPPLDLGTVLLLLLKRDIEEINRFSLIGSIVIIVLFLSGIINFFFYPILNFLLNFL